MKPRKSPRPVRAPSATRVRTPAAVAPVGSRVVVNNVSWDQYEQMVDLFAENRLFMTYDDGRLELRMPSQEHEEAAEFLNGIINVIALLWRIKIAPLGSTTFRSPGAAKGLEPDKCYYVQNVATIHARRKIDLSVDPPPDLAFEIEITRSLVPRLPIYRQLGIPELWRYDGKALTIELLSGGEYRVSPQSKAFPKLTAKLLLRWMQVGQEKGYSAMLQAVETWCKKQG